MNLTLGSLFSGVGGFELGAEQSDIKTIWNCEINDFNRRILKKKFPNAQQFIDITELKNPPYVDIICGGFPCQDISIANGNKSKGIKGERSGLWFEMERILREVRPKYVFIENSPMLLSRGFEYVLSGLSKIGYNVEWRCLQATQFGYNHKRERLYVIAYAKPIGYIYNNSIFRGLQEVLQRKAPRQNDLSMPFKRFNGSTISESIRMDDGFPKELDKRRIEAMGNAVIPEIAHYLCECVKYYESNI